MRLNDLQCFINEMVFAQNEYLEADLRQEPENSRRKDGERIKKYGKLNNSDSVRMRAQKQFINIA